MAERMLESDCGLQQAETKLQPPYLASIQPFCCGPVWYSWVYRYSSALIWGVGVESQRSSRNRRVSSHQHHISSGITQPSHLPPPPKPQPGGLWKGNILGLDRLSRLSHNYTSAPTRTKSLWLCFHLHGENRGYQRKEAFNFKYPFPLELLNQKHPY